MFVCWREGVCARGQRGSCTESPSPDIAVPFNHGSPLMTVLNLELSLMAGGLQCHRHNTTVFHVEMCRLAFTLF